MAEQTDVNPGTKLHDTGYKELFSYPELVQQLIEGFFPPQIASLMDFTTLKMHSGHYFTLLICTPRVQTRLEINT